MKINKLALSMGLGLVMVAGVANASDGGHGTITFKGSITDSPCSITADTANQTVDLGEVSSSALKSGQTSSPKPFYIQLEQCDTATQDTVTTTFTGAADAKSEDMLGITGSASGAGIVITDGSSTPVALGKPSAAQTIGEGSNKLSFSAFLQADGASVTAGDFTSTADFTLAYQ